MSASGEAGSSLKRLPSVVNDPKGRCIAIACGNISGHLFLSKLDESKKTQSKCVFVGGKWYTPSEVEAMGGKKARKWRQSLLHLGRPLSEYSLSQGPLPQQQTPASLVIPSVVPPCGNVHGNSQPGYASPPTTGTAMVDAGVICSSVVNPVLAFIKAFRLKSDADTLKRIVKDHFSSDHVENAKSQLWDSCGLALVDAGISFHSRRDSENRSQLVANIEDIVTAFDALDTKDLIPPVFCEASDLYRLPPISLDSVAEQVQLNMQAVEALSAVVKNLEGKLSNLSFSGPPGSVNTNSGGDVDNDSYASRASSFLPPPHTASHSHSVRDSSLRSSAGKFLKGLSQQKVDERHLNLILFGLPESRSIIDLKKTVDEILEFLADRPVQIKDMFRLGKWNSTSSSRPRPVLIKLCAAWDRKILLVQKRKLQQFRLKGLFLRADVPPEHRLRQGSSKSSSKPESLPSDPNVTQLQSAQSDGLVETSSSVSGSDPHYNVSHGLRSSHSPSPGSVSDSSTSTVVQGHLSS